MTYEELGRQMVYAAAVGETLGAFGDFIRCLHGGKWWLARAAHQDAVSSGVESGVIWVEDCFIDARRDLQDRGLL